MTSICCVDGFIVDEYDRGCCGVNAFDADDAGGRGVYLNQKSVSSSKAEIVERLTQNATFKLVPVEV